MNDLPDSPWSLSPTGDRSPTPCPTAASELPLILRAPSFAAIAIETIFDCVRDTIRAVARGIVYGVEFLRRLFIELGVGAHENGPVYAHAE